MFSSKTAISLKKRQFFQHIKEFQNKVKKDIKDKTNNIFITDYDDLKIGPLFSDFNPKKSYGLNYEKIVENLAFSFNPYSLKKSKYFEETIKETALSIKPVDLEVELKDKPKFIFDVDNVVNPIGLKAKLTNLILESNSKIPWQVDSIVNDKLKATEMIDYLLDYGFDNYYITKIFSAGTLGLEKKFISTKNSITAVDDLITKNYLKYVRENNQIEEIRVYENVFLHNKFFIVLFPGKFEYEQFEIWPTSQGFDYNREYENFNGRTKYANLQVGGYYAARYSVVKYLYERKLQARVLVIREIYNDYSIPVGVWQVRENVANAFKKSFLVFENNLQVKEFLKQKLKYKPIYFKDSFILNQRRLF